MIHFYDTNAILNGEFCEGMTISSVTLEELESIKSNKNKTEDVRFQARRAERWLLEHDGEYEVVFCSPIMRKRIVDYGILESPDALICACASDLQAEDDVVFHTHDISCRNIAKYIFGLAVADAANKEPEPYLGFKEIAPTDDELADIYQNQDVNKYELLVNQYLIIKGNDGNVIDALRWDGERMQSLWKKNIDTTYFSKLRTKDIYQSCAVDSLMNNTITAISGNAGSGKSLLSLMCAMWLIEKGKYDRLVVLFNPTKARGASDMGFYSGDALEKALQNSIGNVLTTKFGDRYAIDMLLQQNKLKLVSMADVRGMEITDSEILWITEAQNTSVDLIKLCLSRVSSGAKVFLEGDYGSQVDSFFYEGGNNGLKRVIDVFKDHEEFGFVELQNVWRSRIAELCELL